MSETLNFKSTFANLAPKGKIHAIPKGEDFWDTFDGLAENMDGRICGIEHIRAKAHVQTQEFHPAGDEILFLHTGRMDIILFRENGDQEVIPLKQGEYAIIPKGVWHTVKVHEDSDVLFFTPVKDNQSRSL